MVPAKVKELPIEYPIDKDLLKLVSEANAKYGEYKSCLKNVDFDSRFFLDSIINFKRWYVLIEIYASNKWKFRNSKFKTSYWLF